MPNGKIWLANQCACVWLQVPKVAGVPNLGARLAHLLRLANRWGAIRSRRHRSASEGASTMSTPSDETSPRCSSDGGSPFMHGPQSPEAAADADGSGHIEAQKGNWQAAADQVALSLDPLRLSLVCMMAVLL